MSHRASPAFCIAVLVAGPLARSQSSTLPRMPARSACSVVGVVADQAGDEPVLDLAGERERRRVGGELVVLGEDQRLARADASRRGRGTRRPRTSRRRRPAGCAGAGPGRCSGASRRGERSRCVTPAVVTIERSTATSSRTFAGPSSVFAERRRAASRTSSLAPEALEVRDEPVYPDGVVEVDRRDARRRSRASGRSAPHRAFT